MKLLLAARRAPAGLIPARGPVAGRPAVPA
jgi:hypothetical protein